MALANFTMGHKSTTLFLTISGDFIVQKYQNCFLASELLLSCFDLLVCILTECHRNTQTLPHLEHTKVWKTSTPRGTTPHPQSQHSCPRHQHRINLSSSCHCTSYPNNVALCIQYYSPNYPPTTKKRKGWEYKISSFFLTIIRTHS